MSNQLVKKNPAEGYQNIFPKTWIDAIKDKESGVSLQEILQGFNMYFLSYNGSRALTRCKVPSILRKEGLWITYVLYDHTVVTEWYNSDQIDDNSWSMDSNWRVASNFLVGDISVSSDGYWVINGEKTEARAQGEQGVTPLLRVGANNKLQVSYNAGKAWKDISDYIVPRFRYTRGTTNDTAGIIQISMDLGKTWTNLSNEITNNLRISRYIGINESLPTSGVAEGTIYMKGPYYDESDTSNTNPIYRMWIYAWKDNILDWQDNGEFQSIAANVVQETGDSETEVMSQKAVTNKLSELGQYVGNPEFVEVHTDAKDKILYGVKTDGKFYFGADCPPQVQEYIQAQIDAIGIDALLATKVDKAEGKSLIDADFASSQDTIENPEWLQVVTDFERKVLEGIRTNSIKEVNIPIDTPSVYIHSVDNPEYIEVKTDNKNRIIEGTTTNGRKKINIPVDVSVLNVIKELYTTNLHLSESAIRALIADLEEHGISGGGVTQEELERKLAEYLMTNVADGRYAVKSIENAISNHSSQIGNINNDIETINQDINTINSALSHLTSPLPSGAIAGDNVWTGSNTFAQAIIGVPGINDNNVALYGQFKDTLNRVIDAADYGFSPSASASDNVTALQSALNGGNKTVVVSRPGTYQLNDSIILDSNTTIIFYDGVILNKATQYFNVFINRGAATRVYDSNIKLIGTNIYVGDPESNMNMDMDSPTFGLRGVLGFCCVNNLVLQNTKILNLGHYQYGIQVNACDGLLIEHTEIRGLKDGIHVASIKNFVIRDYIAQTADDPIGLNAHDFYENQLIYGTIENGLIENMAIYEIERNGIMAGGFASRFLVGAWVDWYQGVSVKQGDIFVNNGKLYRAIFRDAKQEFVSHTEPTIETYSGKQEDSGGFYWKFMCYGDYKSADVKNVRINNVVSYVNVTVAFEAECYTLYQRTLHPDVTPENCPKVVGIIVDNYKFMRDSTHDLFLRNDTSGWLLAAQTIEITFSNIKGLKRPLRFQANSPGYESLKCLATVENFDFRENPDTRFDIALGSGWKVNVKNAIFNEKVVFIDDGGRLCSDCNMLQYNNVAAPPEHKEKGDHLIIDGSYMIYDGNQWKSL